jgi:hypothetical protein
MPTMSDMIEVLIYDYDSGNLCCNLYYILNIMIRSMYDRFKE